MNDITYGVNVDVNNPITSYNVYVASVSDSNIRYIEVALYENGNAITFGDGATATAALVTDGVLIDDAVNCSVSGNIITVPLTDLQKHGDLDVQVTITDGEKVLAVPFPIQVKVTPNIAEIAQINDTSLGSYAEVVQEIAAARGDYETLSEHINAKADADSVYTKAETDARIADVSPSDIGEAVEEYLDDHSELFEGYTKEETDEMLKTRMPSVKDYGAKGDGTTDDTEAIYKAIINNDVVYFPPGVYRTAGIIITNPEHPTVKNRGEENETIEAAPRCPKTLIGAGRRSVLKPIGAKGYGFFCKRCGHVHRGAELPAVGYQCPVCESGRTYLVKINSDAVLKIGRKIEKGDVVPKDYADRVDECTISDLTIEANYTVTIPDDDTQPLPEEETEAVDGTDVNTATQVAEIATTDTETEKRHARGLCLYASHRTTVHNVLVLKAEYFGVELTTNARDCQFTDIKVKYCGTHGISQSGYGNSFANVETSQNAMDGVNISRGGCQFTNVKTWANKRHGLCIFGAKHCMIANVNSQQNYGCGFKMCTGNIAGTDGQEPMYNEITGIQCVGNNFSGTIIETENTVETPIEETIEDLDVAPDEEVPNEENTDKESTETTIEVADGTAKPLDSKPSAFCSGLEASGFVIGGHHNVVRGSDIRAFWGKTWCGVERYAVYFTESAHDNEVELICSEGTIPLSAIYQTSAFADFKFDQSELFGTINAAYSNHCIINNELIRVTALEMSNMDLVQTNASTGDYQYLISARDSLKSNAAVTISNGQYTLNSSPANSGAITKIPPVSLASAASSVGGSKYTGSYYAKIAEGQSVAVGYPLRVFYKVPIKLICPVGEPQKKKLYIKYTARIIPPENTPKDTKWLIMPLLRLQERSGTTVKKYAFINNFKENIQHDMISAPTNNTREICYDINPEHIDVKVTTENTSDTITWTNCDLIIALLKTASANKYEDGQETVYNDPDSIGFKIESLRFIATDGEAFPYNLDGFYSKTETDALIAAEIQNSIPDTDIAGAVITLSQNTYTYDGTSKAPTVVSVTLNGQALTAGIDYTVVANPATNVGQYVVTVSGIEDYTGTETASWAINKAQATISGDDSITIAGLNEPVSKTYTTTGDGTFSFTMSGNIATVSNANGVVTITPTAYGTATMTVTVAESTNYFGATKTVSVEVEEVQTAIVFGVVWEYSLSSPQLARLTPQTDPLGVVTTVPTQEPTACVGNDGNGQSDFDNYMPWAGIERKNYTNEGLVDFTGYDNGETYIYIPKFYSKIVNTEEGKMYFYIASNPVQGFTLHKGSGRYVARYQCDSNFKSIPGTNPKVNTNLTDFRNGITAIDNYHFQYDIHTYSAIRLLYTVEWANLNSQSMIGAGITSGSVQALGQTDTLTYHTGRVSGTDNVSAVQYRWIENPWGNVWDWVDGILIQDGAVYICNDETLYSSSITNSYINTGIVTATTNDSFQKTLSSYDNQYTFPKTVGGSDSTYLCDKIYYNSRLRGLLVAGSYGDGSNAGLFYWHGYTAPGSTDASVGGRSILVVPSGGDSR